MTAYESARQVHLKLCLHLDVVMSHKRVLWSRLQLATNSPKSWKATPHTAWVWSLYVATHRCCSKLHSFTLASPEPEARCVPCTMTPLLVLHRALSLSAHCWSCCCLLLCSRCMRWTLGTDPLRTLLVTLLSTTTVSADIEPAARTVLIPLLFVHCSMFGMSQGSGSEALRTLLGHIATPCPFSWG